MARRGRRKGVNLSQLIRDEYALNADAMPADVVAALAAKGHTVTAQLVSNTKNRMKHGGKGRGRRRAAAQAGLARDTFALATLQEAKRLLDQAGSLKNARRALEAISMLN